MWLQQLATGSVQKRKVDLQGIMPESTKVMDNTQL